MDIGVYVWNVWILNIKKEIPLWIKIFHRKNIFVSPFSNPPFSLSVSARAALRDVMKFLSPLAEGSPSHSAVSVSVYRCLGAVIKFMVSHKARAVHPGLGLRLWGF